MPVVQTLLINKTGLRDGNEYVKKQIKFKNALDPASTVTKGDIRYFH